MNIEEIDKNLAVEASVDKTDIVRLDASKAPFAVYGAYAVNPYLRMPPEIADTVNPSVAELNRNTAGIRLRFKTNSPYIAIHCERSGVTPMPHMTLCGIGGFDLFSVSEKSGKQSFVGAFMPPMDNSNGYDSVINVSGKMTEYVLNFPLYASVSRLLIGVSREAVFEEPGSYLNDKPVIFYGSSITQGGCASRPGNAYQNFLSRMLDIDYVNLGFSGSGMAEDNITKYMSGLDMSAFVSDYDHNAPSIEHLEKTHFKMYSVIREKHPDIPYIMTSKPNYSFNSHDDERRCIIMESYIKARKGGDKNVYFVDGASLLAGLEQDACTVDGCHPNDLGFCRFAQMLYPTLKKALKY